MQWISNRSRGLALVCAGVLSVSACASSVESRSDGGDAATSDGALRDDVSADSFACPADPSALIGQACSNAGQRCGQCSDPCQFCNLSYCDGAHWQTEEIFPGLCDGGVDASGSDVTSSDASAVDASGVACGASTCPTGLLCVHIVMGGGACRVPDDGGMCPPGTILSGDCCVSHSESWQCAERPAACDPSVTCDCASALCNGCNCGTANSTNVECGCFYP